jgi:alkylation response protein AidB-like acyl-CoA dehydrogenase
MTERPGGSDLSHTETTAKLVNESASAESFGSQEWCLDGFKWFSSATDGNLSVVLARTGGWFLGRQF